MNLGEEGNPRPPYANTLLSKQERSKYTASLKEFNNCFAWTYQEMLGLDNEVWVHKLSINPETIPVKPLQMMRLELEEQVTTETKKLINANFIRKEKYPNWIANIVLVNKKERLNSNLCGLQRLK